MPVHLNNNIEMNCIKEKKFLFWKYKKVEHNYQLNYISKFMDSSETFHLHKKCRDCGITITEKFVDKDTLILLGVPVKEIEKITRYNPYIFLKD